MVYLVPEILYHNHFILPRILPPLVESRRRLPPSSLSIRFRRRRQIERLFREEVIESLSTVCNDMGLRLSLVDGSPAALRNAFMHNYGEVEGCSMLLDIGSKTTNVIFIEGDQFFVRSINFGTNAITQEFAKEAGLEWAFIQALIAVE